MARGLAEGPICSPPSTRMQPSSAMRMARSSLAPSRSSLNLLTRTPQPRGSKPRMVSIDIIDTIAAVRLELDDWNGHRYTDLFIKANGEWKIMNKAFHQHP